MDTQAIRLKLKSTPVVIRSWFGSEEVSLMIRTISQHFNIPDKDRSVLPILLARLEARDIAPDYFAGELADELKLDRDKALGISAEVKRNILTPLAKEFSDFGIDISLLDKFQIPVIKGLSPSAVAAKTDAPKIIQDVSVAPPKPVQPAPLPAVGWSQMKPPAPPTPAPSRPATMPAAVVVAAFPSLTPTPATPAAPADPAPVILHEDTTFKAVQKNADFTLSRPDGGADMRMGSGSGVPMPPRPAVLEFGGAPKPPAAAQSGAVHYTDFKAPLSAAPTMNAGPRNIAQIAPAGASPTPALKPTSTSAPMPNPAPAIPVPQPPRPPQASMPTPPQPPQNNKPIQKDFL